ncbi:MAG TPA: ankyrin repeat domain-containing protein [Rhabdochlamydiaceae bacterium]|nr:ankyrin repeat domain-containing protein [Rhabdochlamydiaceae bacterium]
MTTVHYATSSNSVRIVLQDLSLDQILKVIGINPKIDNSYKHALTKAFLNHIPEKGDWEIFLEKAPSIDPDQLKCLLEGLKLLRRNDLSEGEKKWSAAMDRIVILEMLSKKSKEYNWEEMVPYFVEYLQFLVDQGFDVNHLDGKPELLGSGCPLHFAAIKGCPAICTALVSLGANVKLSERKEGSAKPLHLAASTGDVETIKTLIKLGADVNAVIKDDFFSPFFVLGNDSVPLCFAARHPQVIQILVDNGANVNHVCGDYEAHSPLEHTLTNENFEGANILLQKGANALSSTRALAKKKFNGLMDKKRKIENSEGEIQRMKDAYEIKKRLKGNRNRSS